MDGISTGLEIANYFIGKGVEDCNYINQMKVNKMVYIAHGWYMSLFGKILIIDDIQSWKYGTIIPSIYYNYKHNDSFEFLNFSQELIDKMDDDLKEFLFEIWDVYSKYDEVQLSYLTHSEGTAWYNFTKNGKENIYNNSIPLQLIKQEFDKKKKVNEDEENKQ